MEKSTRILYFLGLAILFFIWFSFFFHCFFSEELLTTHMKKIHSGILVKQKWLRCQYCNEVFKTRISRKNHEDRIHGHLRKSCEICNEICPSIRALAKHLAQKHCNVNEDGKIVCLYCNTFQRKVLYQVKYHILATHFNLPDHQCNICGKVFDEGAVMRRHVKTVHQQERPYQG